MSKKLKKLEALQEHIDSQFTEKDVTQTESLSNENIPNNQDNFTQDNPESSNDFSAKEQSFSPVTVKKSENFSTQSDKAISSQNNKTLKRQVDKSTKDTKDLVSTTRKTFYIENDKAKILKFIKFSMNKDESSFTDQALEAAIKKALGVDWRNKFAEYLD